MRNLECPFYTKGVIDKNHIINNEGISLKEKLNSFPEEKKTDLTPKMDGVNNTIPAIKY